MRQIIAIATGICAIFIAHKACANDLAPGDVWSTKPPQSVLDTFRAVKAKNFQSIESDDHSYIVLYNWKDDGPLMGYWRFSGGDISKAPKRYFHFVYAAGSKTNKIIDWNCDDDARSCHEFRESIPELLKPPPPPSPPSFVNPVCAKLAKIVYQPPQDYLVRAAELADAAERQPFATTSPKRIDYRLKLLIDVGSDGIVYKARFSESSGSRLFDRAAQNWVYGFMFAPQDCGAANIYEIVLPVVISVQ